MSPSSTTMSADEPEALAKSSAAFTFSIDQPCLAGFFITFHLDFGSSAPCELQIRRRIAKKSNNRFRVHMGFRPSRPSYYPNRFRPGLPAMRPESLDPLLHR